MATIQLNTTIDQETYDKAGKGFDPVPAGTYEAHVFEIEVTQVKNGGRYDGQPKLNFTFKIDEGQTAEDGTDVGGRQLWKNVNAFDVWSDKHNKFFPPFELIDLGKALGKTPEEIKNIDTDEWVGEALQVTVKVIPKQEKDPATDKYVDVKPALPGGKFDNDQLKNEVTRFRSLENAATSAKAGAKAKSKGFKLV